MSLAFFQTGEFYALASALLWAFAVILFRKSGEQVPPVVLNLFKNNFGLVLLLISMAIVGSAYFPAERSAVEWITLLVSGAVGIALADSLFFASLNRLGAGRSAIVDCLYSPCVILSAFVYLHEPLRPSLIAAMALVVTAIFVGTWEPSRDRAQLARRDLVNGIGMGVAAMVLMAVGIVIAKPVLEVSDVWWATAVRLVGAVPVLALMVAPRRHHADVVRCFLPGPHWRSMIPGSLVGAYLALIFWILGFKHASAGVAGVLNQTSTIVVLILATVMLREPMTWRRVVAILLGFSGAVIVAI